MGKEGWRDISGLISCILGKAECCGELERGEQTEEGEGEEAERGESRTSLGHLRFGERK